MRSTNSVEDIGPRKWGSGGGRPYSGVPLNLQMTETDFLIRLLRMYFSRNWEFVSALSKFRNFGVWGFETPNPPPSVRHCIWRRLEYLCLEQDAVWNTLSKKFSNIKRNDAYKFPPNSITLNKLPPNSSTPNSYSSTQQTSNIHSGYRNVCCRHLKVIENCR
jgi:hypothetical protein